MTEKKEQILSHKELSRENQQKKKTESNKKSDELLEKMSDYTKNIGEINKEEKIIIETFRANREKQANTVSVKLDIADKEAGKNQPFDYNQSPRPKVIKEVDAFMKEYKVKKKMDIREGFEIISLMALEYPKASEWIKDHPETFANAWISPSGWDVLPDLIYVTQAPNPEKTDSSLFLVKHANGKIALVPMDDIAEDDCLSLKEEEIKEDFSWFWILGMSNRVPDDIHGLDELKESLKTIASER